MPRHWPIVVIAPDSFKGSVAAAEAAASIAEGLRRVWPDVELRLCPMADGGEGTLDAVLSRGVAALDARVTGVSPDRIDAHDETIESVAPMANAAVHVGARHHTRAT